MIRDLFTQEDWKEIKKLIGVEIDENTPIRLKIFFAPRLWWRKPYIRGEYYWELQLPSDVYENLKKIYSEDIVYICKHYKPKFSPPNWVVRGEIGLKTHVLIGIDLMEKKLFSTFIEKRRAYKK